MKTNATSGISGTAGTPLSHQAIQSGRDAIRRDQNSIKPNESISDTLETSDREGDGRQPINVVRTFVETSKDGAASESEGLDLIG